MRARPVAYIVMHEDKLLFLSLGYADIDFEDSPLRDATLYRMEPAQELYTDT